MWPEFTLMNKRQRLAVICQSLYLVNLLLLPGLAFLLLTVLFAKHYQQPGWQRIHLYRALQCSILAGLALIVLPLAVIAYLQYYETILVMMILYFVTVHAAFVLLGLLNLSRAMSRKLPLF